MSSRSLCRRGLFYSFGRYSRFNFNTYSTFYVNRSAFVSTNSLLLTSSSHKYHTSSAYYRQGSPTDNNQGKPNPGKKQPPNQQNQQAPPPQQQNQQGRPQQQNQGPPQHQQNQGPPQHQQNQGPPQQQNQGPPQQQQNQGPPQHQQNQGPPQQQQNQGAPQHRQNQGPPQHQQNQHQQNQGPPQQQNQQGAPQHRSPQQQNQGPPQNQPTKQKSSTYDPAIGKRNSENKLADAREVADAFVPFDRFEEGIKKAFIAAGQYEGGIEAISNDTKELKRLLTTDKNFKTMFTDPLILTSTKRKALLDFINNSKLHPLTVGLLKPLTERGDASIVVRLPDSYALLADSYTKSFVGTITLAKDYGQEFVDKVTNEVRKGQPADVNLAFKYAIDPTLIEGYKVTIGTSTLLDKSKRLTYENAAADYIKFLDKMIDTVKSIQQEQNSVNLNDFNSVSSLSVNRLTKITSFATEVVTGVKTEVSKQQQEQDSSFSGDDIRNTPDPTVGDKRFDALKDLYGFKVREVSQ